MVRAPETSLIKELCFESGTGKKKGVTTTTYKQVVKRLNATEFVKFEDYEDSVLTRMLEREI